MVFLYALGQCTWGLVQTLAGLVVFLSCPGCRHSFHRGTVVTAWRRPDGLSLGLFIFVPEGEDPRLLRHEYGHTLQSLLLGPLYLPVIGLPSLIRAAWRRGRRRGRSYYDFYTERWADRWGGVDRHTL